MEIILLIAAAALVALLVFNQRHYNNVFKEMKARHDKTEIMIRSIQQQTSWQHHRTNRSSNVINLNSRRKSPFGKK